MRKAIFRIIKILTLAGAAVFLSIILLPRHYDVPQMQALQGTQFWELSSGSRIGYVLVHSNGTSKSTPVIYLHGGPGGFVTNRGMEVFSTLADDGFDLYFYDQIGSGQSARLINVCDYTAARHVKDLEEVVKQTGADRVILIGQSWGAMLAALFAAEHPEQIAKMILVSPGPVLPMLKRQAETKAPDSLHLKAPMTTNAQANQALFNIRMKAARCFAVSFGVKLVPDKEADDFQTYLNNGLNKSVVCDTAHALPAEGGGGFYAQVMTVNSFRDIADSREKLRHVNVPVLVIKGTCDSQPWGVTNEYLGLFPNHELKIVPDAGHSVSIEQPEVFIRTIREFLQQ